jgi:hypothetical protein
MQQRFVLERDTRAPVTAARVVSRRGSLELEPVPGGPVRAFFELRDG